MAIDKQNFPSESELEQIRRVGSLRNLYQGNQKEVLGLHEKIEKQYSDEDEVVYLSNPFPARIADFYGDYVQGNPEKLQIRAENDNEQEYVDRVSRNNNLKSMIQTLGRTQSSFGYAVLHTYLEDGEIKIQVIPNDQYLPQPDGSVALVTYFTVDKDQYLLVRHYEDTGDDVRLTRQLFQTGNAKQIHSEASLSIAENYFGKSYEPEEMLGISEIPVFHINNQSSPKGVYSKSDIDDVTPHLAEINERASHISTQLLKNLDARLALPDISGDGQEPEEALQENWDTIFLNPDDKDPEYLTNANPLLEDARQHIMFQIKLISDSTGVPMFQITKSGTPDTVYGMKVRHWDADRKTTTKRQNIQDGIEKIMKIGAEWLNQEFSGNITIDYGSIMPEDDLQAVKKEAQKVNAGLTSKVSAIQRLEDMSIEEAEEELDRIRSENRVAGVSDTSNPPTV